MKRKSMILGMILSMIAVLLGACAGQATAKGTMQVYVTDALPKGVTAIEIKASNVEAHMAGAADDKWVSLLKDPPVFDLVKATGVNVLLGSADVEAGKYTQVRLDITDVTVTVNGIQLKATVPSDKLRLAGDITVEEGKKTSISLDFDAEKSIVLEGNEQVLLKPVVKLVVAKPGETLETPMPGTIAPITSPTATPVAKTGIVQMWVTDAPRSDNVSEIWVTVKEVKIHEAAVAQVSSNGSDEAEGEIDDSLDTGGWISVNLTGSNRFDLLKLRGETGGLQQILATANLTTGRYTQIRMTVEKVEVKTDGILKDAVLPSGKLKFVHPFDIEANSTTKLLFDFDADKFVNVTGSPKEPKIMVKPVVKLIVSKPKPTAEVRVKIITPSLPNGAVEVSYNVTLSAIGGKLPYNWSLLSGNLASGLTLSPAGVIAGTPGAGMAGDHTFVVKVSDNSTPVKSDTKQYNITIAEAGTLIITTTSLADGKEGVAYTATLSAIGGTLPYSWSITSGNFPNGLVINSATGIISGTPTEKGNYNFTAQVSDNTTPANTDTQQLGIRIAEN